MPTHQRGRRGGRQRPRLRVAAETLVATERALGRLSWAALVTAMAALAVWAVLQAAELGGATRFGTALAILGPVLRSTTFGHLVVLQAAALLATAGLLRASRVGAAAAAALLNVAAEAGHGHAMAMVGVSGPLFWVDMLHLLAGSAWIGGLLPLLIVVRLAPARTAALAARWFSPLGAWSVVALAGAALVLGWRLVGSVDALFGTPYGWMVMVKTMCFGVLSGVAVLNRLVLAPALVGDGRPRARGRFTGSIALQAVAGAAAVLAAAVLSGLVPGMDMGRGA